MFLGSLKGVIQGSIIGVSEGDTRDLVTVANMGHYRLKILLGVIGGY